ncbi:MAG: hypothetical protein ACKV19_13500 [Verrucomicrobiales bacterium]
MRPLILLAAAAALAAAAPVSAQTSRELAEKHPAAQVVVKFLRHSVNREYDKASDLVLPASLTTLQKDYLAKVKSPRVAMNESTAMCRAVGVEDERGIEAMTPRQFYTAYNLGMQRRYNVTDEVNRRIADTLELKMLSAAEEGPALVHFLVRTQHQTMANEVRHLEIVSLARVNNQWLVSLGEHEPKYKPLGSQTAPAGPPSGASAGPATPTKPAAPAKPAAPPGP